MGEQHGSPAESAGPTVWTYWSPTEPIIDPAELHVGILHVTGRCDVRPEDVEALIAVVPPMAGRQNEPMARVMRDWLAAHDWKQPDGWADWCAAHGQVVRFPDAD